MKSCHDASVRIPHFICQIFLCIIRCPPQTRILRPKKWKCRNRVENCSKQCCKNEERAYSPPLLYVYCLISLARYTLWISSFFGLPWHRTIQSPKLLLVDSLVLSCWLAIGPSTLFQPARSWLVGAIVYFFVGLTSVPYFNPLLHCMLVSLCSWLICQPECKNKLASQADFASSRAICQLSKKSALSSSGGVWPILSNGQPLTFYPNPTLETCLQVSHTDPIRRQQLHTLRVQGGEREFPFLTIPWTGLTSSQKLLTFYQSATLETRLCASLSESYPPPYGDSCLTLKARNKIFWRGMGHMGGGLPDINLKSAHTVGIWGRATSEQLIQSSSNIELLRCWQSKRLLLVKQEHSLQ